MIVVALSLTLLAPRALIAARVAANAPISGSSAVLDAAIERTTAPLLVSRPAISVIVGPGQTLASIAAANHIPVSALEWANSIAQGAQPAVGSALLVPPAAGALVEVEPGESPGHFAARLGLDPGVLLDYNALGRNVPEPAGTYLQVPARLLAGALPAADVVPVAPGVPGVSSDENNTTGANTFPYGQCTWYVASQRNVSWSGNADEWINNAAGIRPEGRTPVANAIVVFGGGYVGHVALVRSVNANGSFVINEMNYYGDGGGWGRVDTRTVAGNDPSILGFIY